MKKNFSKKTTRIWGKGGGFISLLNQGGLFCFIALVLTFVFAFQPLAFASGRSSAGGGELAEFDVGKWALGTAIGIGSSCIGSAISDNIRGINPPGGSFANAFSNWQSNYSISLATGQVNRAFGAAGQYYGWNPKSTIFISSIATGIVGGGLNPGSFGNAVTSTGRGMALGAINGTIEGAILAGAMNKEGQIPAWAGPAANLVSGYATSFIAGGLTSQGLKEQIILPEDITYVYPAEILGEAPLPAKPFYALRNADGTTAFQSVNFDSEKGFIAKVPVSNFSFSNNFNSGEAFKSAGISMIKSLPATMVNVGVNYMTQDMKAQNAYIVKQAFSGLDPIVNAVSNAKFSKILGDGMYQPINRNYTTSSYVQQPVAQQNYTLPLGTDYTNYNKP
ncbi:MAG: hypothetical protein V1925_05255 [Candidatus Omnitrophota bacterium]